MAQAEAQGIVEIFRERARRQFQEKELQRQKDVDASTADARQQQIDLAHQQLDQAKQQFDAEHKLAVQAANNVKATADLQHLKFKSDLATHIMSGGQVPGDVTQPAGGSENAGFSPVGGATDPNATSVLHQIPMGEGQAPLQMQLPTPTVYAKQQADLKRISDAPSVEAKIKESQSLQADMLKKQEEGKASDFARQEDAKKADAARNLVTQAAADKRNSDDNASRERIAAGVRSGMLAAAALRANTLDPDVDVAGHVADALAGKITREDFTRMAMNKATKTAIEIGVKSGGGIILTKEQQKVASDYIGLVDVVKDIDRALDVMPRTTGSGAFSSLTATATGLTKTFNQDVQNAQDRVKGYTAQIGRAISKDNRISNYDAENQGKAYLPKATDLFRINVKKRENLVRQVNDAIDAKLVGVPKAQRDDLKRSMGLDTIMPYTMGGTPSQTAPSIQAPPAPSTPPTLSPQALKIMQDLGIK